MEIKAAAHIAWRRVRFYWTAVILLVSIFSYAQTVLPQYGIKNGRMLIMISKPVSDSVLDNFIAQYDLKELGLKSFINSGSRDSLVAAGWKIDMDSKMDAIISKGIQGVENIKDPVTRILLAAKETDFSSLFPAVSSTVTYGYNRFRNKEPFVSNDSLVRFYLRGYLNAKRVMLAGSFNNWQPDAQPMTKTDSGWIADIKLGAGKYWYKFITDGNWIVDNDNRLSENDGLGNVNSVFYKTNVLFKLAGYSNEKRVYVAGSFNNWDGEQLSMQKTNEGWEFPIYLADGTHTYRFVAGRKWFEDPVNPDKLPNEYGEYNSVVRLGKPYIFRLDGYLDATQVILSGSFNKWRTDELYMKKTAAGWELPYTIGPGNYEYYFIADKKHEIKQPVANEPAKTRNFYLVVEPNHTFRLKGFANAKNIYLAGDFNNWSTDLFAMTRVGEDWVISVNLSRGKHLYKFIVDGKWIKDPANELWEQNQYDTGNSVIWK